MAHGDWHQGSDRLLWCQILAPHGREKGGAGSEHSCVTVALAAVVWTFGPDRDTP